MILIIFDEQLKTTFNNIVQNNSDLSYHWWKFKCWFQDVVFHENSDKLKLSKKFIITHQLLKKDFNQFYFRFFNLEIQSEHIIFTENYHTRLLKSLQNLMNQHDCEYSIIQHVITHADKLWQILNREKIHLELKKKNKIQQHNKNFDQCCCNNF